MTTSCTTTRHPARHACVRGVRHNRASYFRSDYSGFGSIMFLGRGSNLLKTGTEQASRLCKICVMGVFALLDGSHSSRQVDNPVPFLSLQHLISAHRSGPCPLTTPLIASSPYTPMVLTCERDLADHPSMRPQSIARGDDSRPSCWSLSSFTLSMSHTTF